jgi:hypothetical protein
MAQQVRRNVWQDSPYGYEKFQKGVKRKKKRAELERLAKEANKDPNAPADGRVPAANGDNPIADPSRRRQMISR